MFLVVESRSTLYSSKIVYLEVDWLTGYNGIKINELTDLNTMIVGVLFNFYFRSTAEVDNRSFQVCLKKEGALLPVNC